jgi:hypothetical protein
MTFAQDIQLEVVKALLSAALLFLTWFVGQRILVAWDARKKRQELDIVTSTQFHELYGEFKEVSMLWRIIQRNGNPGLTHPVDVRWYLLNRACAVESKNESIIAKLATERTLTNTQLKTLALFRQAVQQLRETIRDDKELAAGRRGPEYELFNFLACEVASIVATKRPLHPPRSGTARANFESITRMRSFDYDEELEKFRQRPS